MKICTKETASFQFELSVLQIRIARLRIERDKRTGNGIAKSAVSLKIAIDRASEALRAMRLSHGE
jgi:hypothetical protein